MSRELHAEGGNPAYPPFQWCGDEEALELYALGRLSPEMEEQFDEHLLVCHACQDRLEQTDSDIATMREMLAQRQPAAGGLQWWKHLIPSFTPRPVWAGALALFALAAILVPQLPLFQPAPVDVALSVVRGTELNASAPGGAPLRLRIDLTELPAHDRYRVEVVKAAGGVVLSSEAARQDDHLLASCEGMAGGSYWVRLYAPGTGGQLLREFGLTVR
ncbi:MAG TPA: hypothetical protein DEH78_13945 [Solibacterales bacterium]|nr:hypothetical protein [Bryobacterales bacterium]